MAKPVKSSIICGLGLGKQRCQAFLLYPRGYSVQVPEPCGKMLGWEANWVSALADLGISLVLKDQNKHKLLRYGGECVEKRQEPLKKGSHLISITLPCRCYPGHQQNFDSAGPQPMVLPLLLVTCCVSPRPVWSTLCSPLGKS